MIAHVIIRGAAMTVERGTTKATNFIIMTIITIIMITITMIMTIYKLHGLRRGMAVERGTTKATRFSVMLARLVPLKSGSPGRGEVRLKINLWLS